MKFGLVQIYNVHETIKMCKNDLYGVASGSITKGVTMHRCIAILGPAIRVSYRDPSIAILKKKKKNFFFF